MYKTIRSKIKALITVIIIIVSLIMIKKLIVDPQPVRDINMNIVYICGSGTEYPDDDQSRYYIEFKKDGTYVLMHDDSRRKDEDYFEDGYRSYPEIEIFFGSYEIKNGNYILNMEDRGKVEFKDANAVKDKKINVFYQKKYKDGKKLTETIFFTKRGNYVLGYSRNSVKSYDEKLPYYFLYNKSDIKKLPSSVEEFRKQFKMDKKAEQAR